MCKLAVAGVCGFEVDGIESQRTGPSFTVDTARELKRRGAGSVNWLIGSDNLYDLPLWHDLPGLLREVEFTVMARAGWTPDWNSLPAELRQLESRVATVPQIEISSTDIRRRVAAGLAIDFLTPPAVCEYIRDQGLYEQA
jgi:nicotinate-nucleotide adenylyltransferase